MNERHGGDRVDVHDPYGVAERPIREARYAGSVSMGGDRHGCEVGVVARSCKPGERPVSSQLQTDWRDPLGGDMMVQHS